MSYESGPRGKESIEDKKHRLIELCRQVKEADILAASVDLYWTENGKLDMKYPDDVTEEKLENITNQFHVAHEQFVEFRHRLRTEFGKDNEWEQGRIKEAVDFISKKFNNFRKKLDDGAVVDLLELHDLYESVGSLAEYHSSQEFSNLSREQKLKGLNEGAERFLSERKAYIQERLLARSVDIILKQQNPPEGVEQVQMNEKTIDDLIIVFSELLQDPNE